MKKWREWAERFKLIAGINCQQRICAKQTRLIGNLTTLPPDQSRQLPRLSQWHGSQSEECITLFIFDAYCAYRCIKPDSREVDELRSDSESNIAETFYRNTVR